MKNKKSKTVALTETQENILLSRWRIWQYHGHRMLSARPWNKKRREAAARDAYAVLNELIVLAYGHGAKLDMSTGKPVVTLP